MQTANAACTLRCLSSSVSHETLTQEQSGEITRQACELHSPSLQQWVIVAAYSCARMSPASSHEHLHASTLLCQPKIVILLK